MDASLKQLKIWNVIMLVLTAFIFVMAGMILSTGVLPFGMDEEPGVAVSFLLPWFFVLAVLTLIQAVLGFLTVRDQKMGRICDIMGYVTWIAGLLLFIFGIGASGYEWIIFFIVTLPPIFHSAIARKAARISF